MCLKLRSDSRPQIDQNRKKIFIRRFRTRPPRLSGSRWRARDYTDYKQEKIFMAQFDKIVFLLQFILLLLLVVFGSVV